MSMLLLSQKIYTMHSIHDDNIHTSIYIYIYIHTGHISLWTRFDGFVSGAMRRMPHAALARAGRRIFGRGLRRLGTREVREVVPRLGEAVSWEGRGGLGGGLGGEGGGSPNKPQIRPQGLIWVPAPMILSNKQNKKWLEKQQGIGGWRGGGRGGGWVGGVGWAKNGKLIVKDKRWRPLLFSCGANPKQFKGRRDTGPVVRPVVEDRRPPLEPRPFMEQEQHNQIVGRVPSVICLTSNGSTDRWNQFKSSPWVG